MLRLQHPKTQLHEAQPMEINHDRAKLTQRAVMVARPVNAGVSDVMKAENMVEVV